MNKYLITKKGFITLEKELSRLTTIARPEVIKSIISAREHGDLKENVEYHAAREEQAIIEKKVSELEKIKESVEVVNISTIKSNDIRFGATVQVLEKAIDKELFYKIVSPYEADIKRREIGITSPLAKALLGKKVNDHIEFCTPHKTRYLIVLSIRYVDVSLF